MNTKSFLVFACVLGAVLGVINYYLNKQTQNKLREEITSRASADYDALQTKYDALEKETEELRWFKKTYLKSYDERQVLKKNYERANMIVAKLKAKYNISNEEIGKLQLCTCPTTSPCYQGKPCNLPMCPICKAESEAKATSDKPKEDTK